jgi:hypothetical protein
MGLGIPVSRVRVTGTDTQKGAQRLGHLGLQRGPTSNGAAIMNATAQNARAPGPPWPPACWGAMPAMWNL